MSHEIFIQIVITEIPIFILKVISVLYQMVSQAMISYVAQFSFILLSSCYLQISRYIYQVEEKAYYFTCFLSTHTDLHSILI